MRYLWSWGSQKWLERKKSEIYQRFMNLAKCRGAAPLICWRFFFFFFFADFLRGIVPLWTRPRRGLIYRWRRCDHERSTVEGAQVSRLVSVSQGLVFLRRVRRCKCQPWLNGNVRNWLDTFRGEFCEILILQSKLWSRSLTQNWMWNFFFWIYYKFQQEHDAHVSWRILHKLHL